MLMSQYFWDQSLRSKDYKFVENINKLFDATDSNSILV